MQEFNRQELEQKLNLSPQSTVFAHLAYLHIQEGEVERGLEICQSHIINHKKYGFGHFVLGLCLHKTGNMEEALNELEVATFLDPNIYEAWKLLKKLYEDRGDEEKTATANNFTGIWEKTEAVTAMAGEEFTVDDFIEDTDLGDTQEESLETIDVNESDDETLEAVDFGKAEESLDDFDLGDLETSDAIETTEELLGVQEKKAEEGNSVEEIDGLDFDEEMIGENIEELSVEESLENFDLDNLDKIEDEIDEDKDEEEKEVEDEIMSDFSDLEGVGLDLGESLPKEADEVSLGEETEEISIEDTEVTSAFAIEETELQPSAPLEPETPAEGKTLTSTLGEIYISQGKFEEALEVFESLLEKKPTNKRFKRKVTELKNLIESQEM